MSAMSDAVKNGPRATGAKVAHIEAQIRLHEAKERKARDQSAAHRKRAIGDGPLAKSRRIRADAQATVADRHRAKANQLRADLAKAKADETARNVKHVKRTVASTAAEGLSPKAASQPGRAKAGQVAKSTGPGVDLRGRTQKRADLRKGLGIPDSWPDRPGPAGADDTPFRPIATSTPTKGTPAMTAVSGEAVDVETTEAMLADLKTQVAGIRATFDSAGGSLASVGLNKLANALNKADDALGSVDTGITDAERELAPHKDIADIAQSTGEMANSPAFYGVGGGQA